MKIVKEFKEFISRGNVIDMAVGIIIGGAFTAIVNSLVSDVVSPVLGLFGTTNLEEFKWVIKEGVAAADGTIEGGVVLAYGSFITAVINFLIMAFYDTERPNKKTPFRVYQNGVISSTLIFGDPASIILRY